MRKIVYKRIDISNTYQGLMKVVECMEDKMPPCIKGEIGSGVTQENQIGSSSVNKGRNKHKSGQGK
jgi:hypothetical protein